MSKLLVIALAPVPDDVLERCVPEERRASTEVRMVAPASRLSPLKWLANEEDSAREEAADRAHRSAERLPDEATVEEGVGDTDPLQATEDALRTFDADQIVVVVPPDDEQSWLDRASVSDGFERFGRPVRYLRASRP